MKEEKMKTLSKISKRKYKKVTRCLLDLLTVLYELVPVINDKYGEERLKMEEVDEWQLVTVVENATKNENPSGHDLDLLIFWFEVANSKLQQLTESYPDEVEDTLEQNEFKLALIRKQVYSAGDEM